MPPRGFVPTQPLGAGSKGGVAAVGGGTGCPPTFLWGGVGGAEIPSCGGEEGWGVGTAGTFPSLGMEGGSEPSSSSLRRDPAPSRCVPPPPPHPPFPCPGSRPTAGSGEGTWRVRRFLCRIPRWLLSLPLASRHPLAGGKGGAHARRLPPSRSPVRLPLFRCGGRTAQPWRAPTFPRPPLISTGAPAAWPSSNPGADDGTGFTALLDFFFRGGGGWVAAAAAVGTPLPPRWPRFEGSGGGVGGRKPKKRVAGGEMGANGAGAGHAGSTGEVSSRVPADGSVPGGGCRMAPLWQTGSPFWRESCGEPGGGVGAAPVVVPSPRPRRRGWGFLLAVGLGAVAAAQGQRRPLPPTLRHRFVPLAPWGDDTWLFPPCFFAISMPG